MRRRQIVKMREGGETRPPSLHEQYRALFGKPPHHRMKPETIEAQIHDARNDRTELRQTA